MAVPIQDIVYEALSIDSNFRNFDASKLKNRVYEFLKRRNLCIRTRTRRSQITESAMQSVKRDYCRNLMTSYCNLISNPKYFLNKYETAVYLNCAPNRAVHLEGGKKFSCMIGGSSSMRFTLAVTIAMDGSKLPVFVIFKGTPGESVERSLSSVLPSGVIGCVQ